MLLQSAIPHYNTSSFEKRISQPIHAAPFAKETPERSVVRLGHRKRLLKEKLYVRYPLLLTFKNESEPKEWYVAADVAQDKAELTASCVAWQTYASFPLCGYSACK